jgi:hypothetical protein
LSNDNISIFTIEEQSNWKSFVTDFDESFVRDFDEDNLACRSSIDKTERRGNTVKISKFKRINRFNSEVTVTCENDNGKICNSSLILLWNNSKLQKECKINKTLSCDIHRIKEQRNISGRIDLPKKKLPQATTTENPYDTSDLGRSLPPTPFDPFVTFNRHSVSRFGPKKNDSENNKSRSEYSEDYERTDIETTTVIAVSPPTLSSSEAVKYSIYVNNTWTCCDELNDKRQKIEVSMTEDSKYIRCYIKPEKSASNTKLCLSGE